MNPVVPTVPCQKPGAAQLAEVQDVEVRDGEVRGGEFRAGGVTADLSEHPDPHTVAQTAAVETLLRCWVRMNTVAMWPSSEAVPADALPQLRRAATACA